MARSRKISIFLSGASWPLFHGLASLFILLTLSLQLSPLAPYIETRVTSLLLFQSRIKLQKAPKLHEKLKIIALDDSSFAYLGSPRLTQEQLVSLLRNIGRQEPRAILIDSLLSDKPEGLLAQLPDDIQKLPIYSGHFPTPVNLRYRNPLDLQEPAYQAKSYLRGTSKISDLPFTLDQRSGWNVYGNSQSYAGIVRSTGHITYNRDGTISPFYQINEQTILPHLSLYTSSPIELNRDGLWFDHTRVPLTQRGSLLINYRSPNELYNIATPLRSSLERALHGSAEAHIQPDDVVLILLAFATGNTDFHESSPFGEIPGGLLIASMISDSLSHSWLQKIEWDVPLILIFGVAGIILGINARALRYWLALWATWIFCTGGVIWAFSYQGLWLPWLLPLVAFTGTSLIHFAHVRIQDELRLVLVEKNYFEEKALRLEETHKKAELETNLLLGRAVQKLLMPRVFDGAFASYTYAMQYKPVTNLSGDWLYVWDYSITERRIFIGDVMGTGPSAAIPMATLVALLKDCEEERLSLDETIARLNMRLYELFDQHVACSLSALSLQRDGQIEIINAGGPGWYVAGPKDAQFYQLRSKPIGLNPTLELARESFELKDDQLAFTFTDGFIQDPKDLRRLTRHLRQQKQAPQTLQEIEETLQQQLAVPQIIDDQSLLCVRRERRAVSRPIKPRAG